MGQNGETEQPFANILKDVLAASFLGSEGLPCPLPHPESPFGVSPVWFSRAQGTKPCHFRKSPSYTALLDLHFGSFLLLFWGLGQITEPGPPCHQ